MHIKAIVIYVIKNSVIHQCISGTSISGWLMKRSVKHDDGDEKNVENLI